MLHATAAIREWGILLSDVCGIKLYDMRVRGGVRVSNNHVQIIALHVQRMVQEQLKEVSTWLQYKTCSMYVLLYMHLSTILCI